MFLSQRPNNDPQPVYRPSDGKRGGLMGLHPNLLPGEHGPFGRLERLHYSPRPEFTQTRDPRPWLCACGLRHEKRQRTRCAPDWSPRHEEFDTPINPILADFRETRRVSNWKFLARNWLELLDEDPEMLDTFVWHPIVNPTQSEIRHARRVLHLLAVISK